MMPKATSPRPADLEIRIFERREEGYPVEITLSGEHGQQEFPHGYLAADILPWNSGGDPITDGRRLFEALLADSRLRAAWAEARGAYTCRRLRLRIDPAAAELHTLPWELLYDDAACAMLSAQADTPFSRYLPISLPWGAPAVEHPIRALVVISNPDDLDMYNLAPLDVAAERAAIAEAVGEELQLTFLDPPVTLERIEEALTAGYHVLHFIGHGAFSARRGQAALYLQDDAGRAIPVADAALAGMLARAGSGGVRPRLIVLVACQGAARATSDAFLGLGPQLVNVGAPAVVAMQDAVSIESGRKFSAAFYRRLIEHGQVDLAVNEARSMLLTAGRPDAGVPVLFMRLKSGRLWEAEEESETKYPPPPEPIPPPEVTGFVGRATELALLEEKLAASHMVIITAMPGMGKTMIAATLARRLGDGQKVFWYAFDEHKNVTDLIWKLAGFLAWHGQPDVWRMLQNVQQGRQPPPPSVLFDYLAQTLRESGYLLCFENFQFADEDPLLAEFITHLRPAIAEGDLRLIIISQRHPPFADVGECHELGGLTLKETLEMFAQRQPSIKLDDDQTPQIYDTRSLAKMPSLTSADFVANLHARAGGNPRLLLLAADMLGQTTDLVSFLLNLSYQENIERFLTLEIDRTLTPEERAVMSAVAVLMGQPGTRGAIEAILEGQNVHRTLNNLAGRHLLRVSEGKQGREYRINTIVRQFYYNALSKSEQKAMHRRAARYYEIEEPDEERAARHFERAGEHEKAARLSAPNIWSAIDRRVKGGSAAEDI